MAETKVKSQGPQTYEGPPTVPPAEPKKPVGKIIDNAELVAMNQLHKLLAKLDAKARPRVVAWLVANFTEDDHGLE